MEWRIDTGSVGECDAAELRSVLEADRDHWLATQYEAAASRVFRRMNLSAEMDAKTHAAFSAEANAAQGQFTAGAALVAEHMATGIDAACALAGMYGGKVTASVSGHDDEVHASGVDQRIAVSVDQRRKGR